MAVKGIHNLSFSSHGMKSGSRLLKHPGMNISKQNFQEHKMFGSKRKNIQIGKKFKGSKSVMHGAKSAHQIGNLKSSGISPSIEEFDKMMSSVTKKGSSKKSMFRSKQE